MPPQQRRRPIGLLTAIILAALTTTARAEWRDHPFDQGARDKVERMRSLTDHTTVGHTPAFAHVPNAAPSQPAIRCMFTTAQGEGPDGKQTTLTRVAGCDLRHHSGRQCRYSQRLRPLGIADTTSHKLDAPISPCVLSERVTSSGIRYSPDSVVSICAILLALFIGG
jgi:hypothetical protein